MPKRPSKRHGKHSPGRGLERRSPAARRQEKLTEVLIRDLLRVPSRYLRSVHLEHDFHDVRALQEYVVTPTMVSAFARVLEGVRSGSGRRAWRVTGDYGSGKSSFALVLAHLLRDPSVAALGPIRKAVDFRGLGARGVRIVPVLVTGAREPLVPAVARALGRTIEQLRGRGRPPKALANLAKFAADIANKGGDIGALLEVLHDLTAFVIGAGHSGVLVVLDELGKFLEYAALHPDRQDVYALQRLAEAASRSGDQPLLVFGLLHQGFHAYAERLPSAARHEWEKVAERFDEVVFDQPLTHTAALVAGALNVDRDSLPAAVEHRARTITRAMSATGWLGTHDTRCMPPGKSGTESQATAMPSSGGVDPLAIYPLHPTLLPVLVRFFARFGQHERSLFSFLLSSEPFALQTFGAARATGETWYRLADFYDYVRAVFGHRLTGASYRSQWLRIAGVVDTVAGLDAIGLRVLKTVAVLNVLDAEHLLATDAVLAAAIADGDTTSVASAVATLKKRGVLYDRGTGGGYCLWPTTSVNLEAAFEAAHRALGPLESVAANLEPYLDPRPLLARRHSIVSGTLRYFEVRYGGVASLRATICRPTEADGVVVIVLCDTAAQRYEAEGVTTTPEVAARPDVLIAVPQPLLGLAAEVQDARCWQWVSENTPELAHDSYAAAEVMRQVAASRRIVAARLSEFTGLQGGYVAPTGREASDVVWTRAGQPLDVAAGNGLLSTLSEVCNALYSEAPQIRNELLNRRMLSSPAAAARMRLIERMFTSADQPLLGIDPVKAPPEKSMYLSVLQAGRVHREENEHFILGEPPSGDDPLHLRPALQRIMGLLDEASGHRVPVASLMAALRERPYGVRAGVIPLLLAVVATAHAHDLAVYENGTFLQRFGPSDFLRLSKVPTAFEFQLCRVTGVRVEVFNRLAKAFAGDKALARRAELLDVVTPLCVFAAQLPEFTRKSMALPPVSVAVRDALLSAREPGPLLFHDLPLACNVDPFVQDESADRRRVNAFVSALRGAMDELRAAFPQLLMRMGARVTRSVGEPAGPNGWPRERMHLADRGRRVALAAREPRLRAFAHRLADTGLEDDAWAEALGSFVIAKPPIRWAPGDEARAGDEIDVLAATFQRVEAVAFAAHEVDRVSPMSAVRIGLTRGDGSEAVRVVHTRAEDEALLDAAVARIQASLPAPPELRLAALSRLLWADMERGIESVAGSAFTFEDGVTAIATSAPGRTRPATS